MRALWRVAVWLLLAGVALAQGGLYLVEIPQGDTVGFSIDLPGTGSGHHRQFYSSKRVLERYPPEVRAAYERDAAAGSFWLDRGHEGILFRGAGRKLSHIHAPTWGGLTGQALDATILVDRHDGVVRFEGVTIHAGERQAIHFGLEHKGEPVLPRFRLELTDALVIADPPATADELLERARMTLGREPTDEEASRALSRLRPHSTVWGLFGYQSDCTLERVELDLLYSAEHASYWHGFAQNGIRWNLVRARAGAEVEKVRNSPQEIDWVPGASVQIRSSTFWGWNEAWSWRGGAGITLQGSGVDMLVDGCLFQGGPGGRSRCIMVDDSGGDFYGWPGGEVGKESANGRVVIRNCAMITGPGAPGSLAIAFRVGNFQKGRPWSCAALFRVLRTAAIGERIQFQFGDVPDGKLLVRDCNGDDQLELLGRLGFPTRPECVLPLPTRTAPLSEGLER